jgi:hypothetical protein
MKMKMKIVIALTDSSNGGKTSTLLILASLLLDWKRYEKQQITLNSKDINQDEAYSHILSESKNKKEDFRLVLTINNEKIGIATAGDDMPTTRKNWEDLFKDEECSLIYIAISKKQGATSFNFIKDNAVKNGYTIIETNPFNAKPKDYIDCYQKNGIKARRLFEIAKSLVEINEQYF